MKKYKSKIKQEFMDLIGEFSVEELVGNKVATNIIEDIVNHLKDVPMTEHYRYPCGGKK